MALESSILSQPIFSSTKSSSKFLPKTYNYPAPRISSFPSPRVFKACGLPKAGVFGSQTRWGLLSEENKDVGNHQNLILVKRGILVAMVSMLLKVFKEQGVVLTALLGLSAFFLMAETAITTLWPWKIRELAEKESEDGVFKMLRSDVTVSHNHSYCVVNIGATALVTDAATAIFGEAGVSAATGVMTVAILLLTEITPKSIAVHNPTEVADLCYSIAIAMKPQDVELVKVFTLLTGIDFSNNMFEGEVPKDIGKLKSLDGLNLSHNNLSGCIPASIGNLSSLEWLDLSSNKLVGMIRERLVDLTFLSFFNVSENQLQGLIPRGKQFNTFGNDSYARNKGLCGFPVSKSCSNIEASPSNLIEEDGLNSNISFGWKAALTGYGCGIVFGLAMGYIFFQIGKPK
ncbi:hypothetical protein PTKIN_Ptkin11bG0192900 [Pterospermum kingtungense]